jgi:hypothetical protein
MLQLTVVAPPKPPPKNGTANATASAKPADTGQINFKEEEEVLNSNQSFILDLLK